VPGGGSTGIRADDGRAGSRRWSRAEGRIYAYFYDALFPTQKNVSGVYPTPTGQLFFWNAAKT